MVLIEACGALVTKDEIMARVWPDTVVEENNLVVQISALRRALGEDRDLIRTVSGRSYRFIGEIRNSVPDPGRETRLEPRVALSTSPSSNLPATADSVTRERRREVLSESRMREIRKSGSMRAAPLSSSTLARHRSDHSVLFPGGFSASL
jgi:non-specific serine/threonine protein kinase